MNEHYEYKASYKSNNEEKEICRFWVDENGDVDIDNLPHGKEIALLLKVLKLKNVEIEFTGRIDRE